METERLRQFLVLCETQNLRKAADLLHMSHSAFHKSLQVLQADLKAQLYAVNGRHIVITPKGKVFYERAKITLEAEKGLYDLEEKKEEFFRVATHETFSSYLLAPHWKKYFEDAALSCYEMLPGRIEEAVLTGHVDLGITYEPIARSGLEYLKIGKVEMKIFALKGVFDKSEFSKIPFVAPITPLDSIPTGAKGLDGWPESLVQRKILYRVDLLSTAMQLVCDGQCAIFIPEFVARAHNAVHEKKFAQVHKISNMRKVFRDVSLVHQVGAEESPELRRIAKMLRSETRDGFI